MPDDFPGYRAPNAHFRRSHFHIGGSVSDEGHRFVAYPTTKPGCFVVTNRDTEGNIPPRPVRCNRAPDDPIHGERSTPLDWYASVVFVLCLVIITALGAVLLGHVLGWLGIIATDPNVEPTP